MKMRLELFEKVRRDRGSAIQTLSNSAHPTPQSVRDAATKYLPKGMRLKNQNDMTDFIFSFDVVSKTQEILAIHESGQDDWTGGAQAGETSM